LTNEWLKTPIYRAPRLQRLPAIVRRRILLRNLDNAQRVDLGLVLLVVTHGHVVYHAALAKLASKLPHALKAIGAQLSLLL
jgi:hypothetical protein